MATQGLQGVPEASQHPSGRGASTRLMREAAQALAEGAAVTAAVKAATLKQLSAIMAFACAKGSFPTFNRHLHMAELAGLGWVDLQPLCAEPAKGEEALTAAVATLVCNLSRVHSVSTCSRR